jgi:hypothetical protein
MYIRIRKDGFIYEYNDYLARNPECEVVSEEVAYPERFIDAEVAKWADEVKTLGMRKRKTKAALDLTTDEIPEPPAYSSPELNAEASRGMP